MKKNDIVSLLAMRGLSPNRSLGQNFLVSEGAARRILDASGAGPGDHVLEIGPGLGALTRPLAERAGRVTAVEIDAGYVRYLGESLADLGNLTLVHADFLKYAIPDDVTLVVSNMPYYCSSEMLFRFAEGPAPAGYFMMQREFARRITASPGSKNYGALSVMINYHCEARELFGVPPSAFFPRPAVASSFMELKRRGSLPLEGPAMVLLRAAVKSAFWGRRKTLRAALSASPHLSSGEGGPGALAECLAGAGIDPAARGETLSVEDFTRLARALDQGGCHAVD